MWALKEGGLLPVRKIPGDQGELRPADFGRCRILASSRSASRRENARTPKREIVTADQYWRTRKSVATTSVGTEVRNPPSLSFSSNARASRVVSREALPRVLP